MGAPVAFITPKTHAELAPREWGPAKLAILARRFGDPANVDELLDA